MRFRKYTFLLILLALFSTNAFSQARVQVIHNSADAAASTVDVWLDNTLLLDDFSFREASPFVNAPSGVDFDITIQPANSTDTTNGLWRNTYNLMNGSTYILVANGIVSTSGYTPATPFDILVYPMGRETASMSGNTDVLVLHGATDAPTVDVVEVGVGAGTIVDDATYGDFAGYLELSTADYSLQVRNEAGNTVVAQYDAPLATLNLQDQALVVLASGFLNPAMNSNGEAFGLFAATAAGGPLVELPSAAISTARVQVIHNCPDAAASTVDVWLDNTLLIDDFEFRTASAFIDAPAGSDFDVRIQPSNSSDTINPLARFTYNLTGGEKYIITANGIVSGSDYSPAPAFDLDVFAGAREEAATVGNTDVLVLHGSTDAPTVDIYEATAGELVNDAMYGMYYGYLELPTADYSLQVRDMTGTTTIVSYVAPLSSLNLDDQAITVVASGFLDPSMNSNGSAFGLWTALSTGGPLVELPVATGITEENSNLTELIAYPNPARKKISFKINLETASEVTIQIQNLMGQELLLHEAGRLTAGQHVIETDIRSLPRGTYAYKVVSDQSMGTGKFVKTH